MKEAGIDIVVLNHATALIDVPESKVIAWSSAFSYLDADESEAWEDGEPLGPFPVTAWFQVKKGEVVVVADPSIVINSIMGRDDNYAFIRYLTSRNGQQQSISFVTSHLPMAPIDVSKTGLDTLRAILANPAGLLGATALVFVVVSSYTLKQGGIVERY